MWNRFLILVVAACLCSPIVKAGSPGLDSLAQVRQKGQIRIAVYNNFPPFSHNGGGIDVDLAQALAEKLGVKAELVWFNADEDMSDDLRNMVWKGHYLGNRIADAMLHVPVDPYFAKRNPQVLIFGGYHHEKLAVARNVLQVPTFVGLESLEVFTREKIGVELATLPADFLTTVFDGRLRENVVHFKSVAQAIDALLAGQVAAVMAPRSEIEGALLGRQVNNIAITPFEAQARGLAVTGWTLGLAVKAENADLAQALQAALQTLDRDGTIEVIFRKHGVTRVRP